ncbi:MAG TPA: NAD(P)-dependent alcohol dehydrogenase [Polyangiales bacterium]|nr:NAD(P)-dependent alcohol dehydrogenase [Polyangiales bacterium]
MSRCTGYAALQPKAPLVPFDFERRAPRAHDVEIAISHCGVCHSDLHEVRSEWHARGVFPMVPGHEIIGVVQSVGPEVQEFAVGDRVGVGCMVDACRECGPCKQGLEQYCERGFVGTYGGRERGTDKPTYGGYSKRIVVDEAFVLHVPKALDSAGAAPLLCAGITTYSPLKHWRVGKGTRVGVVGLGGLGHVAVKIARAMGAEVTLFTSTAAKVEDGKRLGAHQVVVSSEREQLKKVRGSLDFILNCVAAKHNLDTYMQLLRLDGTMVMVGLPDVPPDPPQVRNLIFKRASLAGSLIGGIAETQEMLDFCGEHKIVSDIESIQIAQINEAYERMLKSDVRYRFVIDMASL